MGNENSIISVALEAEEVAFLLKDARALSIALHAASNEDNELKLIECFDLTKALSEKLKEAADKASSVANNLEALNDAAA